MHLTLDLDKKQNNNTVTLKKWDMITFYSIHVVTHDIINTGGPTKDVEKSPSLYFSMQTA